MDPKSLFSNGQSRSMNIYGNGGAVVHFLAASTKKLVSAQDNLYISTYECICLNLLGPTFCSLYNLTIEMDKNLPRTRILVLKW